MSSLGFRTLGRPLVIVLALLALQTLTSCGGSDDAGTSDTSQWLRTAGKFDETPQEIACIEAAMEDLLSDAELAEWLSHNPETITVEEIQVLPHAIDVADRCR